MITRKPNRHCEVCGKPFYSFPCRIKIGAGKYCSMKCKNLGVGRTTAERFARLGTTVICYVCGKTVRIKPSHNNRSRNYCSTKCMAKDYKKRMLGVENSNYKDGRTYDKRYYTIWQKAKKKKDPQFRLRINVGLSIYKAIRAHKAGRNWELLVGYTLHELTSHLEKQFTDGMAWNNYGKWHIDHIIPVSAFNYTLPEHIDFKRCWALKNLQPLWAIDNIKKGKKLTKPFQPSLALEVR